MSILGQTLEQRFNQKWVAEPSGCWVWTASNAPKRCRICGYDTFNEEGPKFFEADTFAWKRDAK